MGLANGIMRRDGVIVLGADAKHRARSPFKIRTLRARRQHKTKMVRSRLPALEFWLLTPDQNGAVGLTIQ